MAKAPEPKSVEALTHTDDTRKNIPTAEYQPVVNKAQQEAVRIAYERRNRDLDPQLVWRGKDQQDWSDLVVNAPPLFIQEKISPRALIEDLLRQAAVARKQSRNHQPDLFSDFNGIPEGADSTNFYQYDAHWANRMILGDSLQVMASLAEREGLRGKVQCIYLDPPYGIKFNSNFQWSTTSRDVKDGNAAHITREPEQVKAFRDTWRDGIHSYLTYLRDRLTVARDLLTESGSIFLQIGDENVHRVRTLMDEIFGEDNFFSQIVYSKTTGATVTGLAGTADYILWYSKSYQHTKYRQLFHEKILGEEGATKYDQIQLVDGTRRSLTKKERESESYEGKVYTLGGMTSQSAGREKGEGAACWFTVNLAGKPYKPDLQSRWKTNEVGMARLLLANRLQAMSTTLRYIRFIDDFPAYPVTNTWTDIGGIQSRSDPKIYVVQTSTSAIQRCILMATDPGDLVLDPTCGSGTTAYAAEQWGRRWITIDTSRVALTLARTRIMGARYTNYLLADSREGQLKEAEVARTTPSSQPTYGNVRHGFVYERVPHITLKSIVDNAEIDVIWDTWQAKLEPVRAKLNTAIKQKWEEWEIPREADDKWPDATKQLHAEWWKYRIARQKDIDGSIAAKAEFEYLYDKPYENNKKVRVAGPFTVESLLPHRTLGVDENDELIDPLKTMKADDVGFDQMILEALRASGVQQRDKEDRITFTSVTPRPGSLVCAVGVYHEGDTEKRAGIFIGPEFGTVRRPDLVEAAREAADAGFDVLVACAFNYEAHTTEFTSLGRVPVLKARMNADLHMAGALKNTGTGNLFVVFGEPDIEMISEADGKLRVKVNGVDVFKPQSGEVVSSGTEGIACWFIDTDYNSESFFVRHAYFLGQNDPYSALKTTLRSEIDADAWATLNSDISRPFEKPTSGRFAVKVINHLGDEVMKVFKV